MVGPVSVLNSRELMATVYAIRTVPTEIRKNIRQYTASQIRPAWVTEIQSRAASSPRSALAVPVIAASAKVRVSDRQIRVTGASSTRAVTSGGLRPAVHGKAVEFGSDGRRRATYRSRRGGTGFQVHNRRVNVQLRPRTPKGTVFWPAAAEMQPRALAMWVQTTVRTILDALEGKT